MYLMRILYVPFVHLPNLKLYSCPWIRKLVPSNYKPSSPLLFTFPSVTLGDKGVKSSDRSTLSKLSLFMSQCLMRYGPRQDPVPLIGLSILKTGAPRISDGCFHP